jgi:hypothetical protein
MYYSKARVLYKVYNQHTLLQKTCVDITLANLQVAAFDDSVILPIMQVTPALESRSITLQAELASPPL